MTRIFTFLLLLLAPIALHAAGNASIEGRWIHASQGQDEDAQEVRIRIWGATSVTGAFHQLDEDPEKEFVVISRSQGSGPYYKVQIVDFQPQGILTWSYDSSGKPRLKGLAIYLGKLPKGGYQGAATNPKYHAYSLSTNGLVAVEDP